MSTIFISDLHISAARPDIGERFAAFCSTLDTDVDSLYILGDLYEYWIGDDGADLLGYTASIDQLAKLSDRGVALYFMHGNRDFLIGEDFAKRTGCHLLPDPTRIDLYGRSVLLTHGDRLCTDDQEHQAWRRTYQDAAWQATILARPIAERQALAKELRARSQAGHVSKPAAIMDVNDAATVRALGELQSLTGGRLMIHGHTHRPNVHTHRLETAGDGVIEATRIVLGDWYTQSSRLWVDAERLHLQPGEVTIRDY